MAETYSNRGIVLFLQGNISGAIRDQTKALQLNPLLSAAYCSRGTAREAKGDLDGAIDDYTKAINIDPSFSDAMQRREAARKTKLEQSRGIAAQRASAQN